LVDVCDYDVPRDLPRLRIECDHAAIESAEVNVTRSENGSELDAVATREPGCERVVLGSELPAYRSAGSIQVESEKDVWK
jgi:hypothetical protein